MFKNKWFVVLCLKVRDKRKCHHHFETLSECTIYLVKYMGFNSIYHWGESFRKSHP